MIGMPFPCSQNSWLFLKTKLALSKLPFVVRFFFLLVCIALVILQELPRVITWPCFLRLITPWRAEAAKRNTLTSHSYIPDPSQSVTYHLTPTFLILLLALLEVLPSLEDSSPPLCLPPLHGCPPARHDTLEGTRRGGVAVPSPAHRSPSRSCTASGAI